MTVARKTYRTTGKKKKSIFLRIALVVFAIYAIVMLIQVQLEISAREQTLADKYQLADQLDKENNAMKEQMENPDKLQEEQAYKDGYAYGGQEVYVETPK